MRTFTGLMALLFIATPALAAKQTLPAVVACEEDDSDQPIRAGLNRDAAGNFTLLVVRHNDDDDSDKLLRRASVAIKFVSHQGTQIFEDALGTVRLVVHNVPRRQGLFGDLSVINDGPGSFTRSKLDCFRGTTITFDIPTQPPILPLRR